MERSGQTQNPTYFPVLRNVHDFHKTHNIVLDGPVIVHLLKPIGADTFEDNAQQTSSVIEVIRDEQAYMLGSPNFSVPDRRRKVTRSSVAANTKSPSNLQEFHKIDALLTLCHIK